MALQFSYEDRFGTTHTECYVFLQAAIIDYEQGKTTLSAQFYGSKAAKDAGAQPLKTETYVIPLSSTVSDAVNVDAHAKALASNKFPGAIEVA